MQVVLKKLRESSCWLRLIRKTGSVPKEDRELAELMLEPMELANIVAKSVVTAKRG
jgi:hypothetical protein